MDWTSESEELEPAAGLMMEISEFLTNHAKHSDLFVLSGLVAFECLVDSWLVAVVCLAFAFSATAVEAEFEGEFEAGYSEDSSANLTFQLKVSAAAVGAWQRVLDLVSLAVEPCLYSVAQWASACS